MNKKILFISFLAVFSQLIFAPSLMPSAQAGWVDFFFPSLRKEEYDPSETLQAPFADLEAQQEKNIEKGALPENTLPLDQPHRDYESLNDWVISAVSESLTLHASALQADLDHHRAHFSAVGWPEYGAFLKEHSILQTLQTGRYNLAGVLEAQPRLLNKGVVAGTYRWLYQVPVMLSYMEIAAKDYKDHEAVNKYVLVNIEVGRSNDAANNMGIRIERWSGKEVKK